MRLMSYRDNALGREKLGVAAGDRWLPAALLADGGQSSMAELLHAGPLALDALGKAADPARIVHDGSPLDAIELLAA